ncbi:MAG: 50S ribosomal protein L24 [Oscillospiraceae bacterium]|jgi:large subunit ribosomal protein L24|nr:50S ribosomal protein L24 [Oscillospiraceae bacterium]MBR4346591.1 50S ribosomal protein L24 [Oscillospiraceae bacterium]
MKNKVHVKTGDTVVVLSGKDKGKKGKVLEVSPKEGKVIVEGINVVKKHVKPTQMGQSGAIVDAEAPLYSCKVQVVDPATGKPGRIGHKIDENGKKTRYVKVGKNK